jgi:hypothetical protein
MQVNFQNVEYTMRKEEDELFYNGTLMVAYSSEYPYVTEGRAPGLRRINLQIAGQRLRFERFVRNRMYFDAVADYRRAQTEGYPFRAYDAVQNYTVTYNDNCHFSFYRDQYQYTGGAHGMTVRYGSTFNILTGRPVPLSAFFHPGSNYIQRLKQLILEQAHRIQQKEPIYFDNYPKLIYQYFNPDSFYLIPDGIAIFYGQYEIGPYAIGIQVFVIPWSEVDRPPRC